MHSGNTVIEGLHTGSQNAMGRMSANTGIAWASTCHNKNKSPPDTRGGLLLP